MEEDGSIPDELAVMRRMLIAEVNTAYLFTASMVESLLAFVEDTPATIAVMHPSFPQGAIRAWATANEVELQDYANPKLQLPSTGDN